MCRAVGRATQPETRDSWNCGDVPGHENENSRANKKKDLSRLFVSGSSFLRIDVFRKFLRTREFRIDQSASERY
jgi:hypothetical protein